MVSVVPHGSVLGPQLLLLYTAELFSTVENKLYGYADDSALVTVAPSPVERQTVSEYMNHDLNKVSVWCDLCGMKLNAVSINAGDYDSLQVTHSSSSVNPNEFRWNCAEGVC